MAVTVEGQNINFDVKPYIDSQNRTIVPIRFIGEGLGYGFAWNEESKEVTVTGNNVVIKLWMNKKEAQVNGKKVTLDTTAVLQQGRAMVPLRFIAENMGAAVDYNKNSNTVNIARQNSGTTTEPIADETEIVRINSATVNMRGGPGTQFDVVRQAKLGDVFLVTSIQGDWYEVALDGGKKAWIIKSAADPFDVSQTPDDVADNGSAVGKTAVIAEPTVNIRSGPGTSYSVVTKVNGGATFNVIGQEGDWYQVAMADNSTGWVASWLVTLRGSDLSSRTEEPGERRDDPAETGSTIIAVISEILVDSSGEEISFSVKGDNKLTYSTFNLDNPRRLVLDFFNSQLQLNGDNFQTINVQQGLVDTIRIAQFTESQVRVVLDLNGPAGVAPASAEGGSMLTFQVGKPSLQGKIIVLDPGHGSIQPGGWSDPGAIGPTNLYERDVVLDIALKAAELLKAKGASVILTRTGDTTLTLAGRASVANNNNADIFVSIHNNANTNRAISGTATYYYGDVNGQGEVRKKLASAVQKELVNALGRRDIGILQEKFAVLRYTLVPSILVETAFISNPEEEKLLASSEFRSKAAEGIVKGIERYFLD